MSLAAQPPAGMPQQVHPMVVNVSNQGITPIPTMSQYVRTRQGYLPNPSQPATMTSMDPLRQRTLTHPSVTMPVSRDVAQLRS